MVPNQKHRGKDNREQRRPAKRVRISGFAAADDFRVLEVNGSRPRNGTFDSPHMRTKNAPGDQQDQERGFHDDPSFRRGAWVIGHAVRLNCSAAVIRRVSLSRLYSRSTRWHSLCHSATACNVSDFYFVLRRRRRFKDSATKSRGSVSRPFSS